MPLEGRLKIHAALEAAGTFFQWHEFNGAHAFIRDEGPRYNPVLAQQCYALALECGRLGGRPPRGERSRVEQGDETLIERQ